jgi:hypothetical protein
MVSSVQGIPLAAWGLSKAWMAPGSQVLQVDVILLLLHHMGTIPVVVQPIAFKAMKFNLLLCWGNHIHEWSMIPVIPAVVWSISWINLADRRESVIGSWWLIWLGRPQQFT